MKRLVVIGSLIVALFAYSWAIVAQEGDGFDLSWSTIDGGGGASSGGEFALGGSIGQPDASGPLTGGEFALTGGFWAGAAAVGPPARVCGDQNDDRVVDIQDIVIDLRIALGLVTPSEAQRELSDLNRDGEVNVFDAIKGLQRVAGLIGSLEECGVTSGSSQPG